MVLKRRSTVTKRSTRGTIVPSVADTPNTRKRAGESVATKAKKIKVEFQELFEQFKNAHEKELSSIVLSMGSGDAGQLGLGDEYMERKRPFPIDGLDDIVTIRAGGMHNICLSKTGKVYTFGCNDDFALGRKIVEDEESMVPGLVTLPSNCNVIDITAGDSHSAVLTEEGKVFIWGSFRDNNGVIGLLKPFERVTEPVELHLEQKIVKIASGENHFVMLTDMGDILTFGCAEQGQLGRIREVYLVRGGKSGMEMLLTPAPMRVKQHLRFTDIWAGSHCTVGKSSDGEIYGCGLNNFTQLGISDELSVLLLTKMTKFNELAESWRSFVFGQHHTIAMTESKKVFIIGRGDYGSLGLGDNVSREEVVEVPICGVVDGVSACSHVSYALLNDGTALSWGCGNTYQLGHGDDEDVNEPRKVIGKTIVDLKLVEVSVGGQHVLFRAVKKSDESYIAPVASASIVVEEVKKVDDHQEEVKEQDKVTEETSVVADVKEVEQEESMVVEEVLEPTKEIMEPAKEILEPAKEILEPVKEDIDHVANVQEKVTEMEVLQGDNEASITGDNNNNESGEKNATTIEEQVEPIENEEAMEH